MTEPNVMVSFEEIARRLDGARVTWAVFAGAAASVYGATCPLTDVDILVPAAEGDRVAALFPEVLLPMPDAEIHAFLSNKRAVIVPELNFRGMFGDVIAHRYNVKVRHVTKYDGLPFKVQDIYAAITEAAEEFVAGVLGCWSPCDGFRSPSKEHYVREGEGTEDVMLMRAGGE